MLAFHSEDNGNCRVYFKDERRLYCWQLDALRPTPRFEYLVCSRDGEPSHPVAPPAVTPDFHPETSTGRELVAFLASRAAATDPRDPDPSREGLFRDHNCWKCNSGEKPCVVGNPSRCDNLHARND